MAILIIAT